MKVRYNFLLMIIGCLHFPYPSQTVTLSYKPIVPDFANRSPRLLRAIQHGYSGLSSSKVDEAQLLRKTMRIHTMVQRSWISSMVVPGLGQIYNKDYWKVPCLYLGFALVGSIIYLQHKEMNGHKRDLLLTGLPTDHSNKTNLPNQPYTEKRIKECERTRNLFIMIASAWYLLNILDTYAGGHDKMVNFKDDIGTKSTSKPTAVPQPTATTSMAKRSYP